MMSTRALNILSSDDTRNHIRLLCEYTALVNEGYAHYFHKEFTYNDPVDEIERAIEAAKQMKAAELKKREEKLYPRTSDITITPTYDDRVIATGCRAGGRSGIVRDIMNALKRARD